METNSTQLQAFLPSGDQSLLTMSSVEIAELCEKRHDHVMRDIKNMLDALELGVPNFGGTYSDAQGKARPCFNLPRDLTMTLITGYSIPLRKRVIDRLDELERGAHPTAIDFSNPAVLLGVVNHLQAQVHEKDAVIVQQGTRLRKLDRLEGAHGTMCITDAAKTLGMKRAQDLFKFMEARRWIYKRPGNKSWLAYQDKIRSGLMDHDDHPYIDGLGQERVATRALVTAKGLVKLADLLETPLH